VKRKVINRLWARGRGRDDKMKRPEPTKEKAETLVNASLNKKKQNFVSLPSKFCPRGIRRAVVLDNKSGKR